MGVAYLIPNRMPRKAQITPIPKRPKITPSATSRIMVWLRMGSPQWGQAAAH
jgi:hypothetical protein